MIGQFMAAAVAMVGRIRKRKPEEPAVFASWGFCLGRLPKAQGDRERCRASEFAHYLPKDNSDLQDEKGGRPGKNLPRVLLLKIVNGVAWSSIR